MKPTPTETQCPPLDDLIRLQKQTLPEADADRLQLHLQSCADCSQIWKKLVTETIGDHTPPELQRVDDTNLGQAALSASSPIVWSSEVGIEGSGSQRASKPRSPASADRPYPFLDPPMEEGELGCLEHYRITGLLGEGGMGYVFDAFDIKLHRRVALKVLKPELGANKSFRERFLQEARAAAVLPDEYIITIYQVGVEEEKDVPFLAMKYLHGESLEHRLEREGKIPLAEVLRIGREVALGLSAAHDRGIIHRDIKPANLWLETPPELAAANIPRLSCEYVYRVKILDFGLARPINDNRRLTGAGLIVGTPQYLAPEQARGLPLDHRCDLFSLGIVLYRMVTGSLPFDGPDTLAQLTALAVSDPPPLENLAPDVPEGLRNLIHQLLARDPAKRPPTARTVAERLRALEKAAYSTTEMEPLAESVETKRMFSLPSVSFTSKGGRRWLAAGGFLLVLLVCGFLLWQGLRPGSEENAADGLGENPIKVGILFSQSGSLVDSGSPPVFAAQLAIKELNEQGGLLGRKIKALHPDGASDSHIFAEKAEELIKEEKVCALFGTRISANRKAVREIVQKYNSVLFYPMQFEGLEQSPNIVYLGAAPNQQMLPAVDYILDNQNRRRLFLVGSDYVYPRAANKILEEHVLRKYLDARIVDVHYIPFGSTDVKEAIKLIKEKKPDLIVSTVIGETTSAFFREFHKAGLRAPEMPILSFTLNELDLRNIGVIGEGHYAAWSYFQSIKGDKNKDFVRKFQKQFPSQSVISDPMETVYIGVHLWAQAVQAAGSVDSKAVLEAIKGRSIEAPEGTVRVDRDTRYAWRVMRIGQVRKDGQFEIIYSTDWAYPPQPYPSTHPREYWNAFLENLYKGWGNRWMAEDNKP